MSSPLSSTIARVRRVARLKPFDVEAEGGRALERERRIVVTMLTGLGAKVVGYGVQFAVIGLLTRYLGDERYGVWATLLSTMGWLNLVQLGVGPSLVNALSAGDGKDDPSRARVLVSSSFALQLALGAGCAVVLGVAWSWIPWGEIVNAKSPPVALEAGAAAAVITVVFILRLPLGLSAAIFQAYQEGYLANLWRIGGSVLVLAGVPLAMHLDGNLGGVALAYQVPPLLALMVATGWLFWRHRPALRPSPRLVERSGARSLTRVGVHFVVATIAAAVILATDNLVIAQNLGPEAVTPYSVTFLLTQLVIQVVMLLLDASWPAYSEAAGKGDVAWLRRTHRRVFGLSAAMLAASAVVFMAVARPLVEVWTGSTTAVPPWGLLGALVLLATVQGSFLCTGRLITALGAVHVTAGVGVANAVINLTASLLLVGPMGSTGVALGTVIGYAASGWILFPIARRELEKLATGEDR